MSGTVGFVFPGQGTQRVGMGGVVRSWSSEAAAVYEEASDLLGCDVVALCVESDEDTLRRTENAQVAIYTTNAAVLAVVRAELGEPAVVAGHSVGEWSALHAAGVVSFSDGLLGVRERARTMAAHAGPGGMLAISGIDVGAVERSCADACRHVEPCDAVAVVAAENAPRSIVTAGTSAALTAVADSVRSAGATGVTPVRTSHAFHSPLMAPSLGPWEEALVRLPFTDARVPVALNVTGELERSAEVLRRAALDQIVERVRWSACLEALVDEDVDVIVEVGDSKVLTAFARATVPDVPTIAMGAPNAVRALRTRGRRGAVRGE